MALQNQEILQQAADQARGLAIDAVHHVVPVISVFHSVQPKSVPFYMVTI